MRPFLECGDVVFLMPVGDSVLEVGTVINYPKLLPLLVIPPVLVPQDQLGSPTGGVNPFSCRALGSTRTTLHRIVALHYSGGTLYYETKGDNNLSSDKCYVEASLVQHVLVSVEKGAVVPAVDVRLYDLLYDDWKYKVSVYNALMSDYDRRLSVYKAYLNSYCPHDSCPSPYYLEALSMHETLEASRKSVEGYGELWDEARMLFEAESCRLFQRLC